MSNAVFRACLQDLVGPNIAVGVETVTDDRGMLPKEKVAVAKAIDKRRSEFAAGRRAARAALTHLGLDGSAIPQGENRNPVWPDGIAGSITHDAGLAMAAVTRKDVVTRIGIDLAEAAEFPEHLRGQILHSGAEQALDGLGARIVFSAKECVFKAFYGDVERYFGFDAVEVRPDQATGRFDVTLNRDLGRVPKGAEFIGRFAIQDTRLIAALVTRQP